MKITSLTLHDGRETRLRLESSAPAAIQQLRQEQESTRPVGVEDNKKVLSRRSQLEIRMDMLAAVKEGAEKPTQIMYKANLSWVALQTHLSQLLERGLLRWVADGSRKRYEITMKGANVMYSYVKILEEIGEDTGDFLTVGM
jgi:predicted transcriptional regulator